MLLLGLYVKNLDDNIVDGKLKELFSSFGTITSCKVMRDPDGTRANVGYLRTPNLFQFNSNVMNTL